MTPRFTAASAIALALLATTACTRSADDDMATETTGVTDTGEAAPPATAGMDEASPGTASHAGATPPQPAGPPASGDRADSETGSSETGAPDR